MVVVTLTMLCFTFQVI